MDKKLILGKTDHTLLKQTSTWEQIKKICDEGMGIYRLTHRLPSAISEHMAKRVSYFRNFSKIAPSCHIGLSDHQKGINNIYFILIYTVIDSVIHNLYVPSKNLINYITSGRDLQVFLVSKKYRQKLIIMVKCRMDRNFWRT